MQSRRAVILLSKSPIRKLSDKVILRRFIDDLEVFIALWQREDPDKPFDEFLLSPLEEGATLKGLKKHVFKVFQRVVAVQVDLWRGFGAVESFDQFLINSKARLSEIK